MPPFLPEIGHVGDVVTKAIEPKLERRIRDRDLALARPGQEIHDVGVEPNVSAADTPEAERTG